MNIVFLSSTQNYGGAQRSTVEMAKGLSKNHNVLIVDIYGFVQDYIDHMKMEQLEFKIIDAIEHPIILHNSSSLKKTKNYLSYIKIWIKYRMRLDQILKDFGADVIFVSGLKPLSILKRRNSYKIVYYAHGWYIRDQISLLSKLLFNHYKPIFIAISEATRHAIFDNKLSKLDKIYVVPNSIKIDSLPKVSTLSQSSTLKILHCGGFIHSKGQHISLRIVKKLKDRGIKSKLVLAGFVYKSEASLKYFDCLKTYIESNSLTDNVEFVINNNNVLEYFYNSDILLHPSETEGLPRVVMEAMAYGKPVLANPVGGIIDFIIHGYSGYLPTFNMVDEYVYYIEKLLNNKDLYNFISENQKAIVRNSYSEQGKMEKINLFLNELSGAENE